VQQAQQAQLVRLELMEQLVLREPLVRLVRRER